MLDRIVRDTVFPEPALLPLRQAAAAPATYTDVMANEGAPQASMDGLNLLLLLCSLYSIVDVSV
jgi:hypothetical protein